MYWLRIVCGLIAVCLWITLIIQTSKFKKEFKEAIMMIGIYQRDLYKDGIKNLKRDYYTEDLLRLGASYVIDTTKNPLYETVMEITNGIGADAAIDSIGGSSGTDLAFCVHPHGNFLTIGLLSGMQVNWTEIIKKAKVNANMFHLRNWNKKVSINTCLITLINDKKLSPMMTDSLYELSNVKKQLVLL